MMRARAGQPLLTPFTDLMRSCPTLGEATEAATWTRRMNSRATEGTQVALRRLATPRGACRWRGGEPAQAGLLPFVARGFNRCVCGG